MRISIPLLLVLLVGCGGGSDTPKPAPAADACGCGCGEEEETGGGAYTEEKGTAAVKGTVRFEGKVPKRRPIDMGAVKYCLNAHTEKLLEERVIVGPDGGLANVFVQVTKGLRGWRFPKPTGSKVIDQVDCTYKPHMLGLRLGQKLLVRSSDPIAHNIHAYNETTGRDLFNFGQTKKGAESERTIAQAGMVKVKCEVHGWMSAWIGVVKHPFFAVTGPDGAFALEKLPPGEYTIQAWHEKYGAQTQTVTVADGETKEISFRFSRKR